MAAVGRWGVSDATLVVVIPTLNEQGHVAGAIRSAQGDARARVVVVDGGSEDQTRRIAARLGAEVRVCERGRAAQMNHGAALAGDDDLLLFLHADTRLPAGYGETVRRCLASAGVACGAFRLRIDGPERVLRLIERGANGRSRWLGMPYGDQALFMSAEAFRRVGGFPAMPVMEDFELVRRLRGRGRVVLADQTVDTSARRWRKTGPWRLTLVHQLMAMGYLVGVSPERIATWRRDRAGAGRRESVAAPTRRRPAGTGRERKRAARSDASLTRPVRS